MSPNFDRWTHPDEMPLWPLLREDFEVHERQLLRPGFAAVAVHRMGRHAKKLTGPQGKLVRGLVRLASTFVRNVYGIELPVTVAVGRRLNVCHQSGIVINEGCTIGHDCVLRHGVTLGLVSVERPWEVPVLGDGVEIGPNAVLIGGIEVGDGARIGPLAHVIHDVPPGAAVLAPLATIRPPRSTAAGSSEKTSTPDTADTPGTA